MSAARILALGTLLALCGEAHAAPFTPPPLTGFVADPGSRLAYGELSRVDAALASIHRRDKYAIAALVVAGVDDPIEDVAYRTFNAWKIGDAKADDGVLIVIAPDQRAVRIETGKGIGGDLTDLQSSDIIRLTMAPLLATGAVAEAITAGAAAIVKVLPSRIQAKKPVQRGISTTYKLVFGSLLALFVGCCIFSFINDRFRKGFFGVLIGLTYIFRVFAFFASKGSSSSPRGGGRSGGGGASGKY